MTDRNNKEIIMYVGEAVQTNNVADDATTTLSVGDSNAKGYHFLVKNPAAVGGANLLLLLKSTDTTAAYLIKPQHTIRCGPFAPGYPPSLRSSSGTINNVLATPLRDLDGDGNGPFEVEVVQEPSNSALAITVNDESSDTIAVDLSGGPASGEYIAEVRGADMLLAEATAYTMAETGGGAEISTTAKPTLLFSLSAAGAAQITVTDVSGASDTDLYLVLRPLHSDGPIQYQSITFDAS
jgi:hypothetical protein